MSTGASIDLSKRFNSQSIFSHTIHKSNLQWPRYRYDPKFSFYYYILCIIHIQSLTWIGHYWSFDWSDNVQHYARVEVSTCKLLPDINAIVAGRENERFCRHLRGKKVLIKKFLVKPGQHHQLAGEWSSSSSCCFECSSPVVVGLLTLSSITVLPSGCST